MKTIFTLLLCAVSVFYGTAQITSPQVKANFGVDADLRDNFVNVAATATGNDDWFFNGNNGIGKFVIDTSGATALYNEYLSNAVSRNKTVIRNMSVDPFSIINTKMLINAVFVRDFHGDDSTIFASGSNKNGMNPSDWVTPEAQSVPDKNEILDIYMHVRRDGRSGRDSLWMFGAVSIENTNGNRYFDFEMFQSDIAYNRTSNTFTGYGPDAGHTTWQFDAAGNIIKAGDIILTAEYGSSSLTMIEARIWINRASLGITPSSFSWSGQFDGAGNGSEYGYASIRPKTEGAFYSGLQNSVTSWGGSFKIIRGDNSIATDYEAKQFMEFSVNLTKLGLDPVTILGGSTCDMPFQRVMVKTRASTSFTAELKDFVAPFTLNNFAKPDIFTLVPLFCGVNGVSNLQVVNPISTSVYNWETIGGHFADTLNKTSVNVDAPGIYIVHQRLQAACPVYATDTIMVRFDASCGILLLNKLGFTGNLQNGNVYLKWNALPEEEPSSYTIEKSTDGTHYMQVADIAAGSLQNYSASDIMPFANGNVLYYRLAVNKTDGSVKYSQSIKLDVKQQSLINRVAITPNPVINNVQLQVHAVKPQQAYIEIFDGRGNLVLRNVKQLEKGTTLVAIPGFENKAPGIYTLKLQLNNEVLVQRFMVGK